MSDVTTQGISEPVQPAPKQAKPAGRVPTENTLSRLALVIGLWVAVAAVYWPSSVALSHLKHNTATETYTHGYLILLISLWFVIRERHNLAATPTRPVPRALIGLLLLSAVWAWAWRANLQELHVMLVPMILFTALIAVMGTDVARQLVFPVGYLYFAMPFWSDGNFILQTLSARMTGALMGLAGVPALMQGNLIRLPGGTIQIAGGCSGLHAFIVGLALATLYGKLFELPWRRRWSGIVLMGALAVIVNWVRIFIVVVAAYATNMHSSLVHNHYWLGWWLFAAAFAGFLWWMERRPTTRRVQAPSLPKRHRAEPAAATSGIALPRMVATVIALSLALLVLIAFATGLRTSLARNHYWLGWSLCAATLAGFLWWLGRRRAAHGGMQGSPSSSTPARSAAGAGVRAAPLAAALVALSILPVAAYGMDWTHAEDNPRVTIQWPAAPAGWEGPAHVYASEWRPHFVRAGGESLRAYTNIHGETVQVFAVAYRVQTQHAKLLAYRNHLLSYDGALRAEGEQTVDSATGRWRQLQVLGPAGTRSLIWFRYRIGERTFVRPRLSQLWYGLEALLDPPRSSLTALRTACQPDCRAAHSRLALAARALQPRFSAAR